MNQPLFKRILFATDMSDNVINAAYYAVHLAHDNKAHLTVVHVISDKVEEMSANMRYDIAAHCDESCVDSIHHDSIEEGTNALTARIHTVCAGIIDSIPNCQVVPEVSIRTGDSIEQIVSEAETDDADLIVVGARGHSMLDEILVGSVARGVVKKSPVPVMTIPLPPM